MEDHDRNIIHINSCSEDSNSEQCNSDENNETIPLLYLEKGKQKDIKIVEPASSRKRTRLVNYTISGSGCIERKGRKRLKVNDNNYVNIDISSHNRIYPRSITRRVFRPRYQCWIMVLLLCVVMSLTILGYVVTQNEHEHEYYQYKNVTPINSTLSYNDWFYCRY